MLSDPAEAKRALRALIRADRPRGDDRLLVERLSGLPFGAPRRLAGFWPLPGEPDLAAAWAALAQAGHRVLLPETTLRGQALRFRLWRPGALLLPGRFGTVYPNGPVLVPELVFVPLLAWDRSLARLGYGGGYYDRTLSALPDAPAIGVGFAAHEVATVPVGPYDVPLDGMLTEHGLVTAEGQAFADLVSGRHRRA